MTTPNPSSAEPTWNLFATELQRILQTHGQNSLWCLQKLHIYPSKIQRLRLSLKVPNAFPTLNPEEMRRVRDTFQLSEDEYQRLRAALLATVIEAELMDRVNQNIAFQVAQRLFPVFLDMFVSDAQTSGTLSNVESGTLMDEETELVLLALTSAGIFSLIDRAGFTYHASCANRSTATAIDQAQQSIHYLQKAQRLFVKLSPNVTASEMGVSVQQEIHDEIDTINRHLNRLTAGADE